MRAGLGLAALGCAAALAIAAAGSARAAAHCPEPGADWADASPAQAGMDATKLAAAIDYATANQAAAVRVYRYGCRVASDRLAAVNAHTTFQSWSMAKSITALIFGRAMTQGLVGPDDPLGSLIPVADQAHGAITMRDLLTQTSGLQWNGLRDYNILMPDRIARGAHGPGGEAAGHLLGVLAERAGAARGGDPERRRRGLPGLRPARAPRPDRHRARHVALAARLGRPHAGLLRPPHGPRRLRPARRAAAPRRRLAAAGGCSPSASCARRSRRSRRTAATAI